MPFCRPCLGSLLAVGGGALPLEHRALREVQEWDPQAYPGSQSWSWGPLCPTGTLVWKLPVVLAVQGCQAQYCSHTATFLLGHQMFRVLTLYSHISFI